MSRPRSAAVSFSSRKTILTSDKTLHVERDTDGEYLVRDDLDQTVTYLGHAPTARKMAVALADLLDENDEE